MISIVIVELIFNLAYGHQTPETTKEYDYMMYYMILPQSIRVSIGHQFSDLVKGCSFHGVDCLNSRLVSILFIAFNKNLFFIKIITYLIYSKTLYQY